MEFIRKNTKLLLFLILFFSLFTKSFNLFLPDDYYFDEIYYGFTAEEYARGNAKAWIYDYSPPKGFAYAWDHPPMGKLIMAGFIKIFGFTPLSRRLAPMTAGILLSLAAYHLAKELFKNKAEVWLMAAALVSLDGLVFSMSRIALTDTILALFIGLSILFLWKEKYKISAVFFGLSMATKWTGVYLIPYISLYLLLSFKLNKKLIWKNLLNIIKIGVLYVVIGISIYLISYLPLLYEYGGKKLWQLHQQMYWYHTGLEATHPYQSRAYTWPIDLKPVWLYVNYAGNKVSHIWAMGNPFLYWSGVLAFFGSLYLAVKKKSKKLIFLLLAYLIFWVPWIFSPRIMFLYHYLPSVPFMCVFISYFIFSAAKKLRVKNLAFIYLSLIFLVFGFFYSYWANVKINRDKVFIFQWFKTWKPR